VKLRISAFLAFGFLLVGYGCSDAANRTGGNFLASQGFSIESRDTLSTLLPVTSVEVVPVEGIPAPPGSGGLWTGGFGADSIRAVVAFSLHAASTADGSLQSIRAVDSLRTRYPVSRLHFGLDTAGIADTTLAPRLRVRFVLLDSTSSAQRGALMGLLMGREPSDLGLTVARDVDSNFSFATMGGVRLDSALRAQVADRLTDTTRHSWLVAIIDGHPGEDVIQIAAPVMRTDSTAGVYSPGTFQDRTAWRSTQMRGAGSPSVSTGWWVDGGRRLRMRVDGEVLRKVLHDRLGSGSVSDSFDNSFNVLSARIRAPFQGFTKVPTSVDDRGLAFAGSIVLEEAVRHTHSAKVQSGAVTLPADLGLFYRTQLGLTVDPKVVCDDTTYPGSGLVRCQYYQEGGVGVLPSRLSLGYGSSSLFTSSEFLLRSDVADSMEFRIASVVRVRLTSSGGGSLRMDWSFLQTAISESVVQRKFQLDLDLVPGGGSTNMHDLWEAVPKLPQVADSLHLVVRPRGGAF